MNQTKYKKYIFEGYSDDTFGEYGVTNIDYDDGASESEIRFSLSRESGEGVVIAGQYTKNGTWNIGMALLNEDYSLNKEDWRIYFEPNEYAYCNRLIVEAPDDTKLECLRNGEKET